MEGAGSCGWRVDSLLGFVFMKDDSPYKIKLIISSKNGFKWFLSWFSNNFWLVMSDDKNVKVDFISLIYISIPLLLLSWRVFDHPFQWAKKSNSLIKDKNSRNLAISYADPQSYKPSRRRGYTTFSPSSMRPLIRLSTEPIWSEKIKRGRVKLSPIPSPSSKDLEISSFWAKGKVFQNTWSSFRQENLPFRWQTRSKAWK